MKKVRKFPLFLGKEMSHFWQFTGRILFWIYCFPPVAWTGSPDSFQWGNSEILVRQVWEEGTESVIAPILAGIRCQPFQGEISGVDSWDEATEKIYWVLTFLFKQVEVSQSSCMRKSSSGIISGAKPGKKKQEVSKFFPVNDYYLSHFLWGQNHSELLEGMYGNLLGEVRRWSDSMGYQE